MDESNWAQNELYPYRLAVLGSNYTNPMFSLKENGDTGSRGGGFVFPLLAPSSPCL